MARTPGAKNKFPQQAKENIQAVFVRLGGTTAMTRWAMAHQTEFYRIYARLLPVEVLNNGTAPVTIQIIKFGDVEIPNPALGQKPANVLEVTPTLVHADNVTCE